MTKADTIVADIHAIRREIESATEGMSPAQVTEYFRVQTAPIIERFGFKIYTNVEEAERAHAATAQ